MSHFHGYPYDTSGKGRGKGRGKGKGGHRGGGWAAPAREDRAPGKGWGAKGGGGYKGGGGKGKGGGKGGGSKPFWRQFVDPSDDPEVIEACCALIRDFLNSGAPQQTVSHLSNAYRNTLRHYAPQMGAGWRKVDKGQWELVRADSGHDVADRKVEVVECIKRACEDAGGVCRARHAFDCLPPDLVAFLQVRGGTGGRMLPFCRGECVRGCGL